jgi:hypothetical protein
VIQKQWWEKQRGREGEVFLGLFEGEGVLLRSVENL